jgi:hypothetical protein
MNPKIGTVTLVRVRQIRLVSSTITTNGEFIPITTTMIALFRRYSLTRPHAAAIYLIFWYYAIFMVKINVS